MQAIKNTFLKKLQSRKANINKELREINSNLNKNLITHEAITNERIRELKSQLNGIEKAIHEAKTY